MSFDLTDTILNIFMGTSIFIVLSILIGLIVFLVLIIVGRWKLFTKAGIDGWKSIIPIYSDYIFIVKVCKLHWAFFVVVVFLTFGGVTVFINKFVYALCFYNLATICHKDKVATTIFGALFTGIVTMVYGISNSTVYDLTEAVGNCGFLNRVVKD